MNTEKRLAKGQCIWLVVATVLLSFAMVSFPIPASPADDKMEAGQLVEKARMAFDSMAADPNLEALVDLLKKARGVFICPALLKGAFVVGVSGGAECFWPAARRLGMARLSIPSVERALAFRLVVSHLRLCWWR